MYSRPISINQICRMTVLTNKRAEAEAAPEHMCLPDVGIGVDKLWTKLSIYLTRSARCRVTGHHGCQHLVDLSTNYRRFAMYRREQTALVVGRKTGNARFVTHPLLCADFRKVKHGTLGDHGEGNRLSIAGVFLCCTEAVKYLK